MPKSKASVNKKGVFAVIVAKGARLQFRQAEEADLDYIMAVEHNPIDAQFVIPYDVDVHRAMLNGDNTKHFIVETHAGEAVGFVIVSGLENPYRELEFMRIMVAKQGEGYGKETVGLLLKWGFESQKAHRAWLDCKPHNARALHVYETSGFVREGLIRETIQAEDGTYEDLVILGILDREYFAQSTPTA